MSGAKPVPDPYRILGVGREADDDELKAAHRRLAKRHHPDAGGEEQRFLAVQDAYQLLSDSTRRRDWDRRHAPGPVRARDRSGRARAKSSSPWTREDTSAFKPGRGRRAGRARYDSSASGAGRDPRRRTHTWSAEGVPWWEDFVPKGRPQDGEGEASDAGDAGDTTSDRKTPGEPPPSREPRRQPDFDVYDRSSGAAWSMAARRHFRRGDADLPSRGAFRYRGTQVVTGAEARKVAAEEEAAATDRSSRARAEAPSQPTSPRPRPAQRPPSRPTPPPPSTRSAPTASPTTEARPETAARSFDPIAASPTDGPVTATTRHDQPASPAKTSPDQQPARGASTSASASHLGSATMAGAVAGPVTVLAGAGLMGGLDGSPGATLLLMLGAAAIAGGAIGRGLANRRST